LNNDLQLVKRAKAAIRNKLPLPCGQNCPVVCCDPVITGSFMPRNLLFREDGFAAALEFINGNINETLDQETTDGNKCFKLEGIFLTEIDTDNGFIDDTYIEKIVLEKAGSNISPEKMKEYVLKIKEKFKETNTGLISIFSCPHYAPATGGCTIHLTRPRLCRNYVCEQLAPEKLNFRLDEMINRISLKKEQRATVIAGSKKDPVEAIRQFLNRI
jgi:Fe-S-cluster containining protein